MHDIRCGQVLAAPESIYVCYSGYFAVNAMIYNDRFCPRMLKGVDTYTKKLPTSTLHSNLPSSWRKMMLW